MTKRSGVTITPAKTNTNGNHPAEGTNVFSTLPLLSTLFLSSSKASIYFISK
jgi:hypothetical protein